MTCFQLPSLEKKALYVRNQFDRIAGRYNLTNQVISMGMHHSWKKKAVAALLIKPTGSYLDICCGTGDLAFIIAKHLRLGGKVTGIDFSTHMLSIAGTKSQLSRLAVRPSWIHGNAEQLPFSDKCFDGAIISFGLRNLTDRLQGIRELARVVKRGGRVVNLDLGHPTLPVYTPLFMTYFRHLVPLLGLLLQGDREAYTYLPESLKDYPNPSEISAMFHKAGLTNVTHLPLAWGAVSLHAGVVS